MKFILYSKANKGDTVFVSISFTKFNQEKKERQFLAPEIHACSLKYSYMKLQEIPNEWVTSPHSDAHMIGRVFSGGECGAFAKSL